jgi:predicted nucleotidyltransferase
MDRPSALDAARSLVAERYPTAVQAWLAGSVSRGQGTATSDLDITVLMDELDDDVEVHRETLDHAGWPVELFVHTPASIHHYVAKDLSRRHPTMARLVANGVPLLPLRDNAGGAVRRHCEEVLERGPGPVAADDLELMRYGLTDLLDDLGDVGPGPEAAAVAVTVWRAAAELALASAAAWNGTGKWLVRELQKLDEREGTHLATALDTGLRRALAGERGSLVAVADGVLDRCGGRYRAGLYRAGDRPAST